MENINTNDTIINTEVPVAPANIDSNVNDGNTVAITEAEYTEATAPGQDFNADKVVTATADTVYVLDKTTGIINSVPITPTDTPVVPTESNS